MTSGRMFIELVRHGRTLLQEEHRYVGSTDDELSPAGRASLVAVPVRAPAQTPTVMPGYPRRVYVTTLQRTAQTAEVVFPNAEYVAVPGLEEMDFGAFEARSHAELEHDAAYRAWLASGCLDRCPCGEAKDEFCERVCDAFVRLVDGVFEHRQTDSREDAVDRNAHCPDIAPQEDNTLTIVAHGGTIMAVMERFGRPRQPFFEWRVAHGCGLLLNADAWMERRELWLVRKTVHVRENPSGTTPVQKGHP